MPNLLKLVYGPFGDTICAIITNDLYIFTPFFTAVYIVERLGLQTIYVVNKEILQFLGLKSAVYNREQFQIKSGL